MIVNRSQLATVLKRIIWMNSVHHASVNFPVKEFGSYALSIPFTVMKKPSDWTAEEIAAISPENMEGLVAMLPKFDTAVVSTLVIAHTHTRARARAHTHTHTHTHTRTLARMHTLMNRKCRNFGVK